MAKDNGPKCRFCRREGLKLFLKGERCFTDKCSFERHEYPPGMHGQKRAKLSEFGVQLREKQKVRRVYGMTEKPFKNMFKKAVREKGVTSDIFFKNLELRLDNVVYRMGFARSRQEAKQIVRHNHVLVNGKKANISSIKLKVGDVVTVPEKDQKLAIFADSEAIYQRRASLPWIEVDRKKYTGKIIAEPHRDDIGLPVKERLIVELYSK